ncbi:replication initiator protein A [Bradyrhizobium manausense]|uniref:Uncharacterized protein n=1 Tax=Bradyrhizobium manausense TaxID=989370 RepID=A0A0R3DGW2_9BRAD|nr:replication initiator protein A [Bradyrhizobium manausense]KRQ09136.1 hypothetical protein AOQ71_21130 [Bradyrhizobium manausense]
MEATTRTDNQRHLAAEAVYLESTLLRVFGVLFCHDPKRARTRTGKVEINRGVAEKGITVRLDPEYAQPGPFAHKVAMAILRKQSRFGSPAQNRISFSQRELMKMTGRKTWGGRDSEELELALKQIRYTHVVAHFKQQDKFIEHDFSIFNEVLIERRNLPNDPITACTVVIADPIIQSLNDRHFACLNYSLIQDLSSIAAALYIRLFYHFSILYDGKHLDRVGFKKRYDDICAEWLGGITVQRYRSDILRDQLGTHLDLLVAVGFLKSYSLAPAETREGFVLSFQAGQQFAADYKTFYASRAKAEFSIELNTDNQTIGEPLEVAYLFAEKITGKKRAGISYVPTREVETAKEILTVVPMERIDAFLDFALVQARRTNFEPQTLAGIRQYINPFLATGKRQAAETARKNSQLAKEQEERLQADYGAYLRTTAAQVFDRLPDRERIPVENAARSKARPPLGGTKAFSQLLFEVERTRLVVDRYPEEFQTFEKWKEATQ